MNTSEYSFLFDRLYRSIRFEIPLDQLELFEQMHFNFLLRLKTKFASKEESTRCAVYFNKSSKISFFTSDNNLTELQKNHFEGIIKIIKVIGIKDYTDIPICPIGLVSS